ncbi:dnaJ homolog subfamily C member 28-like isoform X2 [Mya arenaria]|uniref:dnaJ homolog subfamily C member 28-like isoform X2 n=1 Tax=Mya arenaria TaxID=6604 RepID=UPI0022DF9BD6|nr:dnaJ homolog subfamily C member 28-like isoform X2 [Mya arenaria]
MFSVILRQSLCNQVRLTYQIISDLPLQGKLNLHATLSARITSSTTCRVGYQIKDNLSDCYNRLNVPEDCTVDELKEAYFKLAREYHPDSKSSTADARKFNQVKEAYKAIKSKLNAENGSKHSVYNDDDDDDDDSFKRQQPQHRQFLDNEGFGTGTRTERQKQYEQIKVSRAQQNVYKYKLKQKMMTSDSPDDNALVQKDKKYARSKKMTSSMDRLVEDLIQESMSKGDFQNLEGSGKPLNYSRENPHTDKITQKLNEILKDNNCQPEWIMIQKEIREELQKCRERLAIERKLLGDPPYKVEDDNFWKKHVELFQINLNDINDKVHRYNLVVPMLHRQIMPYGFDREIESICNDCDQYLPENFKEIVEFRNKPKLTRDEQADYGEVFRLKHLVMSFKDVFSNGKIS